MPIATVGDQALGPSSGPPDVAEHGWYRVDERQELGDIVAVAASQAEGEGKAETIHGSSGIGILPF